MGAEWKDVLGQEGRREKTGGEKAGRPKLKKKETVTLAIGWFLSSRENQEDRGGMVGDENFAGGTCGGLVGLGKL